jgi:hypothetical protein
LPWTGSAKRSAAWDGRATPTVQAVRSAAPRTSGSPCMGFRELGPGIGEAGGIGEASGIGEAGGIGEALGMATVIRNSITCIHEP